MSRLIISRLLAMRAELDAMLEDLGAQPEPANETTPRETPKWMKLPEFAAHMNMSVGTLRKRLDEGMPASGSGHGRRIKVADAEAWLSKRNWDDGRLWDLPPSWREVLDVRVGT